MKIALIYDAVTPSGEGTWVEAEYESPETIEALLGAIGAHCDEVVPVPFGSDLVRSLRRCRPDMAFNIAEGREGPARESVVPAVLELLDIPYTGSDGVALGVSLNKALTKTLAQHAGIPTPPFRLVASAEQAARAADEIEYPVLVKPNFGGSSVGIGPESIVSAPAELAPAAERCLTRFEQPCLVEGYVRGVDVTVGLLGNGPIEALPVGEVAARGGMYSELAKNMHDREIICPCGLTAALERQLTDWSVGLFGLIGARDFARVDYMLGADGRAWLLEINPLPGLSPYYGVFPELARAAGYGHTRLIGRIIELARERNIDDTTAGNRLAGAATRRCAHR